MLREPRFSQFTMSSIGTRHWQNDRSAPQRPTGERGADCRSNLEKYFGDSAQSDQMAQVTREKRKSPAFPRAGSIV
jgi:hypothetical protein